MAKVKESVWMALPGAVWWRLRQPGSIRFRLLAAADDVWHATVCQWVAKFDVPESPDPTPPDNGLTDGFKDNILMEGFKEAFKDKADYTSRRYGPPS